MGVKTMLYRSFGIQRRVSSLVSARASQEHTEVLKMAILHFSETLASTDRHKQKHT